MKPLRVIFLLILSLACSVFARDKVLVFRQGSVNYQEVVNSVKEEVDGEFEIVDHILDADSSYNDFAKKVRAEKPNLLLLLDNQAVDFARKFNTEKDEFAKNLKSVAAMGLNLREILKGNKNICGVEYEVPAYSLITNYRFTVDKNIKTALVFYRKSEHEMMISTAEKQLAKEGITLKAIDTESRGSGKKEVNFFLKRNLIREIYHKNIDVVWVISDSVMMNNDNFGDVWLNAANRKKVAFISGISSFASEEMNFCVYAASPNHQDLGNQVAQLLFSVLSDGVEPAEIGVEYILSVKKSLNKKKLREYGFDTRSTRSVDKEAAK